MYFYPFAETGKSREALNAAAYAGVLKRDLVISHCAPFFVSLCLRSLQREMSFNCDKRDRWNFPIRGKKGGMYFENLRNFLCLIVNAPAKRILTRLVLYRSRL
jgi:hypothetical protein